MIYEDILDTMDEIVNSMLAVDFTTHEIPATATVKLLMMDKLTRMVAQGLFPKQALTPIIQRLDVIVSDDIYKEHTTRINSLALRFCTAIGHAVEGLVPRYGMEPTIIMITAAPIEFNLKME